MHEMERTLARWRSYHFYYRGSLDLALLEFVGPCITALLRERQIETFFFIRYADPGPHLRIRVLPRRGKVDDVEERLKQAASGFLARRPSPAGETEQRSGEGDVPPNRALADGLARFPPEFELERYGGAGYFAQSLAFFTLSSVRVMHSLKQVSERSMAQRLTFFCRQLARQAWSFAETMEECRSLLDYVGDWRDVFDPIEASADQRFEQQKETLCALLRMELDLLDAPSPCWQSPSAAVWNTGGGRRLSWEVRSAPPASRQGILMSQMHMTANRLGLRNVDEVYLSRLLSRSAASLHQEVPEVWAHAERSLLEQARRARAQEPLAVQVEAALDGLAAEAVAG